MSVLKTRPSQELPRFCNMVERNLGIDGNVVYKYARQSLLYYTASKVNREKYRSGQFLENKWYEQLNKGIFDYSVYAEDSYLGDMWACWQLYSRKYLLDIQKPTSLFDKSIVSEMSEINDIYDLGCGFGYTTLALKEIYPNANVYGTNLENTAQIRFCRLLESSNDIKIITDIGQIKNEGGLVFASEYFEHFYKPVEHLTEIINTLSPKYLLIANAFTAKSLGHFPQYEINGVGYDGKKTSKLFNQELLRNGYEKVKTKLWNNRPNFWRLK